MRRWLTSWLSPAPKARPGARQPRLGVEALGERIVPAAYASYTGGVLRVLANGTVSVTQSPYSYSVYPTPGRPPEVVRNPGLIRVTTVAGLVSLLDTQVTRVEIVGGAGDDTLSFDRTDPAATAYAPIPVTIDGGPGNDRLTGGGVADRILPGGGADFVDGRDGVDAIEGADGLDAYQVGAYQTYGLIGLKWAQLGGEGGFLGAPVTGELAVPNGRVSHFQGGSVYYAWGAAQAFETHGAIRDKYDQFGGANGVLGLPVSDHVPAPDGVGWYNHFQYGSVYWTPDTGAHEVHGLIRDRWASLGWERSLLGYPKSDEYTDTEGYRVTSFQGGRLRWRGDTGVRLAFERREMMAAIRLTGRDGVLDAGEFGFLSGVVTDAQVAMPAPVRNLTHKLIHGDRANALFQGAAVGNLAIGSAYDKVERLVRKWFEGADRPVGMFGRFNPNTAVIEIVGGAYQTVSGPLFGGAGPVFTDVYQGAIGDCTLMAAAAEASLRTNSIREMFTDNGDGTFTARFFRGGAPEYVTVDRQLPGGGQAFARPNAGPIWAALLEKAYAQVNESGWLTTLQPGVNSYRALDGGNSLTAECALSALTGRGTMSNGTNIGADWPAGKLLVLGSKDDPPSALVEHNHAYAVVDYDAASQRYRLFNPWGVEGANGTNQVYKPGLLWASQSFIDANFDHLTRTTAAPAGIVPPVGSTDPVRGNVVRDSDGAAGRPHEADIRVLVGSDPVRRAADTTTAPEPGRATKHARPTPPDATDWDWAAGV